MFEVEWRAPPTRLILPYKKWIVVLLPKKAERRVWPPGGAAKQNWHCCASRSRSLGVQNMAEKKNQDPFHWPVIEAEVRNNSMMPRLLKTAPIPLLIICVPFEWIGMDFVGPLHKLAQSHEYILVLVDYHLPQGRSFGEKEDIKEHCPWGNVPLQLHWLPSWSKVQHLFQN